MHCVPPITFGALCVWSTNGMTETVMGVTRYEDISTASAVPFTEEDVLDSDVMFEAIHTLNSSGHRVSSLPSDVDLDAEYEIMQKNDDRSLQRLACGLRIHNCYDCLVANLCEMRRPMLCVYEFRRTDFPNKKAFLQICSSAFFSCPQFHPVIHHMHDQQYQLQPTTRTFSSSDVCSRLVLHEPPPTLQRYLCGLSYINCTDCVSSCFSQEKKPRGWCFYVRPDGDAAGLCGLTPEECSALSWTKSGPYTPELINTLSTCRFIETGNWVGDATAANPSLLCVASVIVVLLHHFFF